jgi:uroporphyrinogen-III synthase
VCTGPVTAAVARDLGFAVVVTSSSPDPEAVARTARAALGDRVGVAS